MPWESEPDHWQFLLHYFCSSNPAESIDPPADDYTSNVNAFENLINASDFSFEVVDRMVVPHDSINFPSNGIIESPFKPIHIAPSQVDRYSLAPTAAPSTVPIHALNPSQKAREILVHSPRVSAAPKGVELEQVNVHDHRNGHGIVGLVSVHGRRLPLTRIIYLTPLRKRVDKKKREVGNNSSGRTGKLRCVNCRRRKTKVYPHSARIVLVYLLISVSSLSTTFPASFVERAIPRCRASSNGARKQKNF